uniref:Uncharacterized protein n=1 Tax=Arundo donax TaxID=35708 RepID=A0A0A9ALX5_ARUDO
MPIWFHLAAELIQNSNQLEFYILPMNCILAASPNY